MEKCFLGMEGESKAEDLYLEKDKDRKGKTYHSFVSRIPKWSAIPHDLAHDSKLSVHARMLYVVCATFADSNLGHTFSGAKRIGRYMGNVSESRCSQLFRELDEAGWITRIRRGLNKTNITVLHASKGEKISEVERKKIISDTEAKIRQFWNGG